jgi:hypothetical protein
MKIHIKHILTFIVFCLQLQHATGQQGIFITVADYRNGKLTYENCTLHLHNFLYDAPRVTVIENCKKVILQKDNIYGFRDKSNHNYRFYKNVAYLIAESGSLYIYTRSENITQGKGYKVVNLYYFSTSAESAILPLSIEYLREACKGNDSFLDLADIYFGCHNITEYDYVHHLFKVNYLYRQSMAK